MQTAEEVTAPQGHSTNLGQHRYGFACCRSMVKPKGQQSTVKIELHTAHGSLLHDAAEHGMAQHGAAHYSTEQQQHFAIQQYTK